MTEREFFERVKENPNNKTLLERLPDVGLPDAWLVSGCLFQTVWNTLTDRDPNHGIRDFDIFYFDDTDLSWEAEDASIKQATAALANLDLPIEIRNQARVHLWYPQKYSMQYPRLKAGHEGIDLFLATACMVGFQPNMGKQPQLYAPKGLSDLAEMIIRPNEVANFNADNYRAKADRWKSAWPELAVLDPAS
ncbi:MAG: nucleotidyltransferase family protein [Pseudomonadota bacterium]